MDRGSLEFLLDSSVPTTEIAMSAITFQILWGLGYLHFEKQIHRDIKPGNILMVKDFSLSYFSLSYLYF